MQIALKEHTRPQFHRQLVCYNRQFHPVFEAHLSGHKCRSLRSEIQLNTRHHIVYLNRKGRTASKEN